jgi:GntR family transcriptional regulator
MATPGLLQSGQYVNNETQWDNSQPIYRQLRDRVVTMILEGVLKEGDPLPSVRNVATEFRLNPLTVLKGYQQLVDEQLVEKRRGRGMYVSAGAAAALRTEERRRFLHSDWPKVRALITRLGLSVEDLLQAPAATPAPATPTSGTPTPAVPVAPPAPNKDESDGLDH